MLEILTPIWHVKMQTARKVRHRIRAVLEWAIAMNYRTDNPCDRVASVLGPQQVLVEHMQALPHQQVAATVATVRSGEVRGATWDEMDTKAHVWTIPAARMKALRDHRVPLCRRAAEVLDAARTLVDGSGPLVFTAGEGKPLSQNRLRRLLDKHHIAAVPHGFRSSFRDWAAEETDHPREVIEAALAHVVGNKVEAAYARSDLFERRRRLMNDWEAYLPNQAVRSLSSRNRRNRESPEAPPSDHGRTRTCLP